MYDNGGASFEDPVEAYAWMSIAAAQKQSREYWRRYVVPFQ